MNDFVLIRKNLFRKKLRAILMLVSILIAFLIFGVLAAFERAFNAGEDVAAADRLMVVNKINFTQPLPIAYFNRVRAIEGVRQVTHLNWFGGYYQDPKNFLIVFAVEPETYMQVYDDQIDDPAGGAAGLHARAHRRAGGRGHAEEVGLEGRRPRADHEQHLHAEERLAHLGFHHRRHRSRPASRNVDTNFMVFQYEYFNETQNFGKDMIGWMALNTTSPSANERVAKAIDADVRQLPVRDLDRHREGLQQGVRRAARQHRADRRAGRRRGLRDHPDDRRQHHGDGRARAHPRDRRAQDAGLFRRRASCAWCSASRCCWRCSAACPGSPLPPCSRRPWRPASAISCRASRSRPASPSTAVVLMLGSASPPG